jgi:hypothetical protein
LNLHFAGHTQVQPVFADTFSEVRTFTEGGGGVTRLQMAGRWTQVLGGVLAWIVFVPLIELVRAAAERLGFAGRAERGRVVERPAGSAAPVASARHRRAA